MENSLVLVQGGMERFMLPATLSVLVVDRSRSMQRFGYAPLEAISDHFEDLKACKDGRTYIASLVTFADRPRVEMPLTAVGDIIGVPAYGNAPGTRLFETVDLVLEGLLKLKQSLAARPDELRIVVGVFTDGEDNRSPIPQYPEFLQVTAEKALEAGFELLTYGFGIDAQMLAFQMGFPADEDHAYTAEPTPEGVHESVADMTMTTMTGGRVSWKIRMKKGKE